MVIIPLNFARFTLPTHENSQVRSALTNTTSDQWPYFHKNLIFLVITSILKYVLFRLMQTCRSPVINFQKQGAPNSLVFYDALTLTIHQLVGLPFSLHRIQARSHRVRKVVKFYNRAIRCHVKLSPYFLIAQ